MQKLNRREMWKTVRLAIVAAAVLAPMYLFASTIDEDEYIKTVAAVVTGAAAVGLTRKMG